jgi:hypothetical protein
VPRKPRPNNFFQKALASGTSSDIFGPGA